MRTVAQACAEGETIHNMPGGATPDQVYAALLVADQYGQPFLQGGNNLCHTRFRRVCSLFFLRPIASQNDVLYSAIFLWVSRKYAIIRSKNEHLCHSATEQKSRR